MLRCKLDQPIQKDWEKKREREREREREINKTYKGRIHAKNLEMLTGPCYLFEAYCNPITEYLLKVFLLSSCSAKFAATETHRERDTHTHKHTQRGRDCGCWNPKGVGDKTVEWRKECLLRVAIPPEEGDGRDKRKQYQGDGNPTLLACCLFESIVCHLERGNVVEFVGRVWCGCCISSSSSSPKIPACGLGSGFKHILQVLAVIPTIVASCTGAGFFHHHHGRCKQHFFSSFHCIQLAHEIGDLFLYVYVRIDVGKGNRIISTAARICCWERWWEFRVLLNLCHPCIVVPFSLVFLQTFLSTDPKSSAQASCPQQQQQQQQ